MGHGAGTRTSCFAGTTIRASRTAPSGPGTTRSRTPSSPATSRRRRSSRSARTWSSLTTIQGRQPEHLYVVLGAGPGPRTSSASTTSWPTTARSRRSSKSPSGCAATGPRSPSTRPSPRSPAGRALRRLPLEPVVPGPASLGRRPQPRGRCEQPPAACAQTPGGGHAAQPGRAGAADGPAARGRRTGGPGARPRAGPDPGPERGSRRGAVGAAAARARRGSHARPDARPAGPAGTQPRDLFFDIEGDPFALDDGVDYLFGVIEPRLSETRNFRFRLDVEILFLGHRRRTTRSRRTPEWLAFEFL